jgi:hypothetical protein
MAAASGTAVCLATGTAVCLAGLGVRHGRGSAVSGPGAGATDAACGPPGGACPAACGTMGGPPCAVSSTPAIAPPMMIAGTTIRAVSPVRKLISSSQAYTAVRTVACR